MQRHNASLVGPGGLAHCACVYAFGVIVSALHTDIVSSCRSFLNVHSRMQMLGEVLSPTELIILDPRMAVAAGSPNDTPYGGAETMPNAQPGDVLEFHALNTFLPRGSATIASLERVSDDASVQKYGAAITAATNGSPPFSMRPSMGPGNFAPDVGQICTAMAAKHNLPKCASRVWRVKLTAPMETLHGAKLFDIVALKGWDNSGLVIRDCKFFGGIDGVHCKSNGALIVNNTMACTGFDVSPWQHCESRWRHFNA